MDCFFFSQTCTCVSSRSTLFTSIPSFSFFFFVVSGFFVFFFFIFSGIFLLSLQLRSSQISSRCLSDPVFFFSPLSFLPVTLLASFFYIFLYFYFCFCFIDGQLGCVVFFLSLRVFSLSYLMDFFIFFFFFSLCLWRALTVEVKWGVEGGGEAL